MFSKTIRKKILYLASFFVALLLRLYFKTLRITFHMSSATKQALSNPNVGYVIMVWHDSLASLPLLSFLNRYKTGFVLISNSRDGDLASYVTERFRGFHALRVKASVRHMAAKEAIEILQQKQGLFVTPDGPKGPRRQIKGGTSFLAQKTCTPLFAFGWIGSKEKTLSTWDRFRIPLPFSRIEAKLIGPILPDERAMAEAMMKTESNSIP